MKRNHLYDSVHRELTMERLDSVPESFYEGVWRRIRNQEQKTASIQNKNSGVPFGVVCWKSVPVFGAFLLAASLYLWYSPPETDAQVLNAAESYVLDTGDVPTNESLLYQIMFSSEDLGLEKNP